jgi:hypothetical protein
MPAPKDRYLFIQIILTVSIISLAGCNSNTADHQTDSVFKLAIHYLNTNKPDSFYQLTDQKFQKKVPPNMWASIYKQKLSTALPLTNLTFITRNDAVSQYRVDGKIPLNCYIGVDKQSKGKATIIIMASVKRAVKYCPINTRYMILGLLQRHLQQHCWP